MRFIRNYSKPIKVCLYLVALVFAVIAIVFMYTKQLFDSEALMAQNFRISTGKALDFTLFGTFNFSNAFIEVSNKHTLLNTQIEFTDSLISAASVVKVLVILVSVANGLLALSLLFKKRIPMTLITIAVNLLVFVIFAVYTKNTFYSTDLIYTMTSDFKTIVVLLCVAIFFALLCYWLDFSSRKYTRKKEAK